jgi:hypothetical protein
MQFDKAVLSNQWLESMKTDKLLFHLCICALCSFDNHVGFAPCIKWHQQALYEQDYYAGYWK